MISFYSQQQHSLSTFELGQFTGTMQVAETRPLSSNEITSERSTAGMMQVVSEEKYNLLKRQLREITEVATIR